VGAEVHNPWTTISILLKEYAVFAVVRRIVCLVLRANYALLVASFTETAFIADSNGSCTICENITDNASSSMLIAHHTVGGTTHLATHVLLVSRVF
jgi:hypothetical protein